MPINLEITKLFLMVPSMQSDPADFWRNILLADEPEMKLFRLRCLGWQKLIIRTLYQLSNMEAVLLFGNSVVPQDPNDYLPLKEV